MDNETTIDSSESEIVQEEVQPTDLQSTKISFGENLVGLWDDGDTPGIKVIKGGVAEAIDVLKSLMIQKNNTEISMAILSLKTSCDLACATLRKIHITEIEANHEAHKLARQSANA